jgi:energy-coupling factor transporter transmembrane protein EcfT
VSLVIVYFSVILYYAIVIYLNAKNYNNGLNINSFETKELSLYLLLLIFFNIFFALLLTLTGSSKDKPYFSQMDLLSGA